VNNKEQSMKLNKPEKTAQFSFWSISAINN
jgi:hypothetical protein